MEKTIIPSPKASQRTKNRIKEHGPIFTIHDHKHIITSNRDCTLVSSKDGWFGWLPVDEIVFV